MKKKLLTLLSFFGVISPGMAHAEYTWTPLINASFFDGIKADMLVAAGGILGLALVIFGLAILMRVMGR